MSAKQTYLSLPTTTENVQAGRRGKGLPPLKVALYSLLLIVLLAMIGIWTSHAVWESIVHTYSANLTALLDADIAALDIWVKNEIGYTVAQAENPLIRQEVESLVRLHRENPDENEHLAGAGHRLKELALPLRSEQDYLGFMLFGRDGTALATSFSESFVGMTLGTKAQKRMDRVFGGEPLLEKPQMVGSYFRDTIAAGSQPFIIAAAPVPGADGAIIAAFVRVLDPDKDFTRILSVARMGTSGDTYAFDEKGFLISDSRFDEQLKEIGILPDATDARSILAIQIRDPGGDMTKGFRPSQPVDQRPFTRMAASALAGESDVDIHGYRDYRGVMVIGAWRWLPEFGFGVATEVAKEDAFVGQRPVKIAFVCLFVLLVSTCCWFLYSSISIYRLKHRIAEIKQLGQYRLLNKIGEGGIGKVFRASHAMLKRPTAVKFLRPEVMTEEMVLRFEREVQLTSSLTHPNTIQIYDYGKTENGIFYYAMELLDGINLAELVELNGPVEPSRVIHIVKHVCYSLEEAHGVGLIHRDIKPMNIMLCRRGGQVDCVKVLDFGLAKEIHGGPNTDLTGNQAVIGTPAYIAPERFTGKGTIDPRSDIYSLGAVAYNLLTGEDVFSAATAVEVCYHVMKTEPVLPSQRLGKPLLPLLEQLVMSCLAKSPEERPANVGAIIRILEELECGCHWSREQSERWWQDNRQYLSVVSGGGVG